MNKPVFTYLTIALLIVIGLTITVLSDHQIEWTLPKIVTIGIFLGMTYIVIIYFMVLAAHSNHQPLTENQKMIRKLYQYIRVNTTTRPSGLLKDYVATTLGCNMNDAESLIVYALVSFEEFEEMVAMLQAAQAKNKSVQSRSQIDDLAADAVMQQYD